MFVLIVFLMFSFLLGSLVGIFGSFKYIRHKEEKNILNSLNQSENPNPLKK